MADEPALLKARLDFLNEELRALHALESWGATLFLSAIALIAKQLIDWSAPGATIAPKLESQIFLLPGMTGIVAFVFLRAVNSRIRRLREHHFSASAPGERRRWISFGLVGWLMAVMPLSFGYAASWYFGRSRQELLPTLFSMLEVTAAIAIFALVAFVWQEVKRRPDRASRKQRKPEWHSS